TTLDAIFNAWQTDRSQCLDAIMLAPTRELVSSLNQRAQDHRLAGTTPGRQVDLADGNAASVGDLIITRRNDRRLRITATDWVKDGHRWTILSLTSAAGMRVRHARSGRIVTLPADYVSTSTELGYATTVHTAQGVTADTMHGVVTGEESRQQLYTMLTRGRAANHAYLSAVRDGDPHTVIQPNNVHLRTATEMLEQILARDATPQSASTMQREQHEMGLMRRATANTGPS
ncbi:MAG TPA: transfer protein Tra, partial [Propionibacteriaceae bacterium]|nr:transfer protein Tra [Propionibacteriaceae bacterium]